MKTYAVGNGVKNFDMPGEWGLPWALPGNGAAKAPIQLVAFVGYLHRAVLLRANAVATVPWAIHREGSDTMLWDSEEPNPPDALTPFADLPELLFRTEAALTLLARAYWFRERSRVRTTGLRWLDPTTMLPYWTPQGISHFVRSVNAGTVNLPVEDVVYVWLRGLSETEPLAAPASAAANAANVLYNSAEFAKLFFARGAIKAGLLTVDGSPLPAERERLKSWWQRFMGGINNAWSAEVVSAAVTYVPVGEGLAELSNVALSTEQREDIATALGVPHSLIMSNASTFATAQQDSKAFYETTIVPECRLIERQLNAQVFFPAGLRFRFNANSLDVFQQDEKERAFAFQSYVASGIRPSIVAQMLGLELPEGVEYEDLDAAPDSTPVAAAPQDAPDAVNREARRERDEAREDDREDEIKRFRAWARKRKNPDPDAFKSEILSSEEKEALLGETGARFPVEWAAYP